MVSFSERFPPAQKPPRTQKAEVCCNPTHPYSALLSELATPEDIPSLGLIRRDPPQQPPEPHDYWDRLLKLVEAAKLI